MEVVEYMRLECWGEVRVKDIYILVNGSYLTLRVGGDCFERECRKRIGKV